MNAVVHPAVRNDFYQWHMEQSKIHPYTIQESALLFETGSFQFFDSIILVDAPVKLRIKRVRERDHISRKEVISRIDKQMPAKMKRSKSDYIIKNNGRKSIIRQVCHIHRSLLESKKRGLD
jgi:dephospho-CoA kinase